MAVKIRVPGALRQLTRGAAIVEVDAGDVSQALDELNQKFPGFKERLYDDKGELRQFINIYRLGQDYKVVTNIRRADVGNDTGWVELDLDGDAAEVDRALEYCRSRGIGVDKLEHP